MPLKAARYVIVLMFALFSAVLNSEPAAAAGSGKTGTVASVANAQKRVEIYVTDWCGYCEKALSYMERKGIAYVAYDIERDAAAKERYLALGGRGIPFMVIGGHNLSGFSPEAIEYYLKK